MPLYFVMNVRNNIDSTGIEFSEIFEDFTHSPKRIKWMHTNQKKLVVVIVIEKLVRPVLFVRILDLKCNGNLTIINFLSAKE